MDAVECGRSYFERGCNCSQAVVAALGPRFGLEHEQCMQIAAAFGGGIVRRGQACGAVTGALMLLGLKYGTSPLGDPSAKEDVYQRAEEFLCSFTSRFDYIDCKDLLGCDLSSPEGRQLARETNLTSTHCLKFVVGAIELLEQM